MTLIFPLVSIIIPTYNYARYIKEAICSVLEQDYPKNNIEIIVVDDGSTDNTHEVLMPFISSSQIRYFFQGNKGKAAATQKAIQEASGDIIFNLDADDYFLPGKISQTVALYNRYENLVHVANPAKFIIDNKDAGQEHFPDEIINSNKKGIDVLSFFYNHKILYGGGSTFSAKSSVLKSLSIPDDVDMYIDEFLVLATLVRGETFFMNEPLSVWRGHSNNYTVKKVSVDSKGKRMLNSSVGILQALQNDESYSKEIKKLYGLHHYTRTLKLKEQMGIKSISDIFSLIKYCFFQEKYSWKQLKEYAVFNRILPLVIINLIKK
jgi:glycosyltransferase involved in cell wall biosynthesis